MKTEMKTELQEMLQKHSVMREEIISDWEEVWNACYYYEELEKYKTNKFMLPLLAWVIIVLGASLTLIGFMIHPLLLTAGILASIGGMVFFRRVKKWEKDHTQLFNTEPVPAISYEEAKKRSIEMAEDIVKKLHEMAEDISEAKDQINESAQQLVGEERE